MSDEIYPPSRTEPTTMTPEQAVDFILLMVDLHKNDRCCGRAEEAQVDAECMAALTALKAPGY